MSKIDIILREFRDIAEDPAGAVLRWQSETGKGAVGILPVYVPEELVHATGLLPVGIWGGHVEISEARAYLPAFACSIMQSIMELELKGIYDNLKAVVISSPCDTLKCFGQKWKGACPAIQFVQPQNRVLESSNEFLVEEYRVLRAKLESATGVTITNRAVEHSIYVYNENRKACRRFTELAAEHPDLISPADRHAVIKARYFMEKSAHTSRLEALNALLAAEPVKPWSGKKVVLSGITAEPYALLDIFAENGFAVAADDLAQESRQFNHDVPDGEDPLYRLAKWWQTLDCSLATDRTKGRIQKLSRLVKANDADAIVICMMKFCDPEEFDYPLIAKHMQEENIPLLYLEIDQEASGFEQARTRIQSFAEALQEQH